MIKDLQINAQCAIIQKCEIKRHSHEQICENIIYFFHFRFKSSRNLIILISNNNFDNIDI